MADQAQGTAERRVQGDCGEVGPRAACFAEMGEEGDAHACPCQRPHGLHLPALEGDPGGEPRRLTGRLGHLPQGEALLEEDEPLVADLREGDQFTCGARVVGRQAQVDRILQQGDRLQGGLIVHDQEREVEVAPLHRLVECPVALLPDGDLRPGISFHEPRQQVGEDVGGNGAQGAQDQRPLHILMQGADLPGGIGGIEQQAARPLPEPVAGMGQPHGPGVHAVEQDHAEFRLKVADLLADRGLCEMQRLSGPGEAEVLGYGEKAFELAQVHAKVPSPDQYQGSWGGGGNPAPGRRRLLKLLSRQQDPVITHRVFRMPCRDRPWTHRNPRRPQRTGLKTPGQQQEGVPVPIRAEISGAVARITIDNPPVNQIDADSRTSFLDTLDRLAAAPGVRVLVLTGAGEQAFCAGADIRGLAAVDGDPVEAEAYAAAWDELYRRIREFPHPVIAAVNGYALGGGFEILLSTDIRIAAEHARVGCTAANLGLVTSIHSLATALPLPVAKELFFTARHVAADEACRMGLVNRVVPLADLEAAVAAMAEQILQRAPLAVSKGKALMASARSTERADHDLLHREAFVMLTQTEDHREARRAFGERRRPEFRGR